MCISKYVSTFNGMCKKFEYLCKNARKYVKKV